MTFAPEYKDPDSVIHRGIDWTEHLEAGDTIASTQWLGDSGITVEDLGFAGLVTRCKVSGGTIGETYRVTNRVTTSGGERLDLSLVFIIAEL